MSAITFSAGLGMELENSAIASGLKRRDGALLERLIEQYQHRLLRFLWHLTRDRALADDLFQETWLRVLERGHQYDARYSFEAWLITIARNLALDRFRRRDPASLDDPRGDDGDGAPVQVAAADPGPLDMLVRQQEGERVSAVLDGLPPYYREALALRFREEMSLEEIARVQDVPISTVKSRLHRALAKLGKKLERLQ
jgi:RNA polymerase sigma-70 factor (ECF subfamily)